MAGGNRKVRNHIRRMKKARQSANTVRPEPRTESEILKDLRTLTQSPGFIHALAALISTSNMVTASGEFTKEDFLKIYHPDRLIRTEASLLIGLTLSAEVDVTLPTPDQFEVFVNKATALLAELHASVSKPGKEHFVAALAQAAASDSNTENPLGSGLILRETFFYGGESAFPFQFEALARERYRTDADWLRSNVGFDIEEAAAVLTEIRRSQERGLAKYMAWLRDQPPEQLTWLPFFTFSLEDVARKTSISEDKIKTILNTFTVHECDEDLRLENIGSYNKASSHPIIKLRDGTYISFLEYTTFQSLYDNPFYWIAKDKKYLGMHSQTRGAFAEKFTEQTLRKVFQPQQVYRNVVFKSASGDVLGEADVILIHGYRAFIFQVKSKRLTLESWRGDDLSIARDFGAAVQEGYDQALECISHIKGGATAYSNGAKINLEQNGKIREFFPICITSEHYPGLAFQSSIFLKQRDELQVMHPIIMDVFTLDVVAEMLNRPMYFTDYLVKRANAAGRISASHELIVLSWYIKMNLHLEENEFITLHDDIMVELDLAMAVRRIGIEGQRTPAGQLTRFNETLAGKLVDQANLSDRPDVHRLGEIILGMNGETAEVLEKGIKQIIDQARKDRRRHDFSLGLKGGGGITIHCNLEPAEQAARLLTSHCTMRKYVQNADRWYGVLVDLDGDPVFMTGLEFPWKFEPALEEEAASFRVRSVTHSIIGEREIGRNDPCPCRSGLKYKKCHGK